MTDILDTLADLDDEDFEFELADEPGTELVVAEEGVMTEARAREITEAIRSAATVTFILLAQAHANNAHKALGYSTWAEYVKEEFDMSAQRSYQLLDLSKVMNEIETVTPEGTQVKLTEAQARDIKRELPLVTEKIKEATEGLDPDAASEVVTNIVDEIREQKKADEAALATKQKAAEEAKREGYQAGLEAAADAMLEEDKGSKTGPDGVPLVEVETGGQEMSPEDAMNLYNFFNVLSGVASLPEPDDFVTKVPKDRSEEVENQLMEAVAWLNRFQTLWELREDS